MTLPVRSPALRSGPGRRPACAVAALLAASCAGARPPERSPALSGVDAMLADVSPARLHATVERLAAFGTRHTLSATDDPVRGIGAARRWLLDEMQRAASESGRTGADAVRVSFDPHVQPVAPRIPRECEIVNVMAEIPGSMPEAVGRRYYVVGHYDSRASDANDAISDAPGANDDGSGTALVVELVRVMAKRRYDATLVFLAVAGEEQGLYGSKAHAAATKASGADVRAVLSDDIVGDPSGLAPGEPLRIRVFSEGLPSAATPEEVKRVRALAAENDSASRQLARFVADVAAQHETGIVPVLVHRPDRFLRGGDHLSFLEQGFPAVRFTDAAENWDRQHQDVRVENGVRYGDVPEFVDAGALAAVTRLNGAVLAHLANAPSSPRDVRVITKDLAHDTTLRWTASPEPDVAGYEIVWRDTRSAAWEHARDAGDVTEITLPVSKDDVVFGVRAYDRDGWTSPVTFAGAAKE